MDSNQDSTAVPGSCDIIIQHFKLTLITSFYMKDTGRARSSLQTHGTVRLNRRGLTQSQFNKVLVRKYGGSNDRRQQRQQHCGHGAWFIATYVGAGSSKGTSLWRGN